MRHICPIIWIALLWGFPNYTFSQTIDQEIFVPVEGSRLYVRLIGNASGPILLNLHGGPGAFSGFDHEMNRHYLEEDYLVAYLDQRGGGKSDPCLDSTKLNMQQFVQDVDVVVDTLRSRFPERAVNLIGASWGGTLGLLYLIKHQDKIQAFACVSGKADGVYPIHALIKHEMDLAESRLKQATNAADSAQYEQILSQLHAMRSSDMDDFYDEINLLKHDFPKALGFDVYWANKAGLAKAADLGEDPAYYDRANYTQPEFEEAMKKFDYVNGVFRNDPEYNHLNIIDEIAVIHKPVLVLQGEMDYAIGQNQARMIYQALDNVPKSDKDLHIIGGAAHNLNLEATAEYFQAILDFFNRFNKVKSVSSN